MNRPNAERWFIISKLLSRVDNWWPTTHFEQSPIIAKGFTAPFSCSQISRSPNCFWFSYLTMGRCLCEQLYLPWTWARYMNYLIPARRDNRFDIRFPLERLSSKHKQHELCLQMSFGIRTKIARNRIASIAIASEASTIQFDEPQYCASSDSLKPIAMTSP